MNYTANQRSLHQFGGLLYGFRFLRFRQQGIRQGVHPQEHSADRTVKASPTEGPDLLLERVGINCHLKQDGLGCLEVTVEYGDYSMLEEGRSCTPTTNQVVIQPVVKSPLSADNPASLFCAKIKTRQSGRDGSRYPVVQFICIYLLGNSRQKKNSGSPEFPFQHLAANQTPETVKVMVAA